MFDDTVYYCQNNTWSHTHIKCLTYKYRCSSLHLLLGVLWYFQEFPLSTKSEGLLKFPILACACEVPLSVPHTHTHNLIHVPTQDAHTDSMNAIWLPIKGPLALHEEVVSRVPSYLRLSVRDTFMSWEKKSNGIFKRALKTNAFWHLNYGSTQAFNGCTFFLVASVSLSFSNSSALDLHNKS